MPYYYFSSANEVPETLREVIAKNTELNEKIAKLKADNPNDPPVDWKLMFEMSISIVLYVSTDTKKIRFATLQTDRNINGLLIFPWLKTKDEETFNTIAFLLYKNQQLPFYITKRSGVDLIPFFAHAKERKEVVEMSDVLKFINKESPDADYIFTFQSLVKQVTMYVSKSLQDNPKLQIQIEKRIKHLHVQLYTSYPAPSPLPPLPPLPPPPITTKTIVKIDKSKEKDEGSTKRPAATKEDINPSPLKKTKIVKSADNPITSKDLIEIIMKSTSQQFKEFLDNNKKNVDQTIILGLIRVPFGLYGGEPDPDWFMWPKRITVEALYNVITLNGDYSSSIMNAGLALLLDDFMHSNASTSILFVDSTTSTKWKQETDAKKNEDMLNILIKCQYGTATLNDINYIMILMDNGEAANLRWGLVFLDLLNQTKSVLTHEGTPVGLLKDTGSIKIMNELQKLSKTPVYYPHVKYDPLSMMNSTGLDVYKHAVSLFKNLSSVPTLPPPAPLPSLPPPTTTVPLLAPTPAALAELQQQQQQKRAGRRGGMATADNSAQSKLFSSIYDAIRNELLSMYSSTATVSTSTSTSLSTNISTSSSSSRKGGITIKDILLERFGLMRIS